MKIGEDSIPEEGKFYEEDLPLLCPDNFLDTTNRGKMENPCGLIHFLETKADVENNSSIIPLEGSKRAIECSTNTFSALVTPEQYYQMSHNFGIDIEGIVTKTLIRESTVQIQKKLYSLYVDLGMCSRINSEKSAFKNVISDLLGIRWDLLIKSGASENLRLANRIAHICSLIGSKTRLGNGNFIVVSNKMFSRISETRGFVSNNSCNTTIDGIILEGTLMNIYVYVNPYIPEEDSDLIVCGRTTGSHIGTYIREYSLTKRREENKITLTSRNCIVNVGDTGYNLYYTARIRFTKEMGWFKKLMLRILKPL